MTEYIGREKVLSIIIGQFPEAHYPSWYAEQIREIPAEDVVPRSEFERLKAEIERLQKECEITRAYIHNNGLEWGLVSHLEFYKNQRVEAIKEFVERLKEKADHYYLGNIEELAYRITAKDLNDLVKEMERENEK